VCVECDEEFDTRELQKAKLTRVNDVHPKAGETIKKQKKHRMGMRRTEDITKHVGNNAIPPSPSDQ
jgi:hypothetical protein